jgi:hypothetical protein
MDTLIKALRVVVRFQRSGSESLLEGKAQAKHPLQRVCDTTESPVTSNLSTEERSTQQPSLQEYLMKQPLNSHHRTRLQQKWKGVGEDIPPGRTACAFKPRHLPLSNPLRAYLLE